MFRNKVLMRCPTCQTSMRLKSAADEFGELCINFECVFCWQECAIAVEQWTQHGLMPQIDVRH